MTQTQLEIMERADKTKKFGCLGLAGNHIYRHTGESRKLLVGKPEGVRNELSLSFTFEKILGTPFGLSRLYYLSKRYHVEEMQSSFGALLDYLGQYEFSNGEEEMVLKPCIEWGKGGQNMVLEFLHSLPKPE